MSQMGFLGALGGAGQGIAQVGDTLLKDSLQRRQQEEDDNRRMMIEKFRLGEQRAENDRVFERELGAKKDLAKLEHGYKMQEIGATVGGKADARRSKEMFGKVELKNGQVVDESDLRSEYQTRYGKFDPMGNLIAIDEKAPTFDQYRNNQVTDPYRRSYVPEEPGSKTAPPKVGDTREVNGKIYRWTENGPEEVSSTSAPSQPTNASDKQISQPKKADPMIELNDIRRLSNARNLGPATAAGLVDRLKSVWNDLGPTNTEKFELLDKLNRLAKGKT